MAAETTWQSLLRAERVKPHRTSHRELHDLRAIVERDLKDAQIADLSPDRRFATAYNAVLQLARTAVACAGYRVVGLGHHQTAFEALELAIGQQVSTFVEYFDSCRRKRNQVDYSLASAATSTEAEELIQKAEEFRDLVEQWIKKNHPEFAL